MAAELAEIWTSPHWRGLAVLAAEAVVGYPAALHRRLPHPVVWAGALISALERRWNRPASTERARRLAGIATAAVAVGAAALLGFAIQSILPGGPWGLLLFALVGSVGLAQRSLYEHVAAVAAPLERGDLAAARVAVGAIVGRDIDALDERGVCAAAIESLAESFNDGVVAPAFWLLLGGLPGLFAYKAANTADSLIGHREPRWRAFGWAAARLDDLMNLLPARLAGALLAVAGGGGWRVMLRDAKHHASPNAGWPEAAMAGALGRRLGGAVRYDGVETARPSFGDGPAPGPADLRRALSIYLRACAVLWLLLAMGGLAWLR